VSVRARISALACHFTRREEVIRLSNGPLATKLVWDLREASLLDGPGRIDARSSRIRSTPMQNSSNPDADPDTDKPGKDVPNPSVPPDMEPVVPQQDPPQPGRPGDGQPPPIVAT
jgi:predicted secreted protein